MNPDVTLFYDQITPPWQAAASQELRTILLRSIPGVVERLQYRKPHYLRNGSYAAVLSVAGDWISLLVFKTERLDVPPGVFEPHKRGFIKIREGQKVNYAAIEKLLKEANA